MKQHVLVPPARLHLCDSLGVFVVHDGQELIHRQHLGQWLSIEELLCPLQGDCVGQRPVGVVGHHQVADVLHRLLVPRVHLLPAKVSAAKTANIVFMFLCLVWFFCTLFVIILFLVNVL